LPGKNSLIRKKKKRKLSGKTVFEAKAGDQLIIKTPGGGGWGEPPVKMVRHSYKTKTK
jgi:N-methylhydantoinase B/oxoprolinase/acetone carboxylase alpha subunit